jgi:Heterokaryon incompatibility protein (HET)
MGKYVALSHCWGGNMPLKTTHGCLNAYMEKLPVSLQPQNFQDAMKITMELGVRYLWIDSLCIIQDSLQDWKHECTVMGDVYANASITISAAAAKNCDDEILRPRLYEHPRLREHDVLLKLEEVSSSIT